MLGQILTDAGTNEKDSLTDLQSAEQGTLARQQSSPWVSPWIGILWLLPAIALLLTLAATQRLLYRRSRRVLSKYLTMAAAAVIALCVVASHVIVLEHSFRMASGPLGAVITTQEFQTAHDDHEVETGLTGLIGKSCDQCEATLRCEHMFVDPLSYQLPQRQLRAQAAEIAQGDWADAGRLRTAHLIGAAGLRVRRPNRARAQLPGPQSGPLPARLYKAWYRYVTLAMLALAWLAVTRAALADDADALVTTAKRDPPHVRRLCAPPRVRMEFQ